MSSNQKWQKYWAKARHVENEATESHALVCHLLDVAAVADVILQRFPRRLDNLADLIGAKPKPLQAVIVRLAALHDIGKFHPDFQCKLEGHCEEHLPDLAKYIDRSQKLVRHDILGFLIANQVEVHKLFEAQVPSFFQCDFDQFLWPVMLHHGRPSDEPRNQTRWEKPLKEIEPAIRSFVEEAFALMPSEGVAIEGEPCEEKLKTFSWALAGLMVLADWIGSSEAFFPYCDNPQNLSEYWHATIHNAERAVEASGILAAAPRSNFNPLSLLPRNTIDVADLSPLQKATASLPIDTGPNLFIIEDITGAGKTEAALILAQRLMAARAANGFYFALPTMATSNAMYDRLSAAYRLLFEDNATPSLVLAHGRRDSHDGFTGSVFDAAAFGPNLIYEENDAHAPAEQVCARWIADSKRKAFFAHAGVGTIDQALLAVLPTKYQALRLWALADRVLIVDEVHAYAGYLSKELERLVTFHTALGGSTILLSATLPSEVRRGFVSAWAKGAGVKAEAATSKLYPLITAVSKIKTRETAVEARAELSRAVPVTRLNSFDDAADLVATLAKDGAPVAWIRNAVDDAIEACEALRERGLEPLLLHARFAMGDRIARESKVHQMLGRTSTPDQRRGFVIVGTQILQESLDYDVDAMVSDLAPVDLIIQRAGRLWRHPNRTGRFAKRELFITSPEPESNVDADWYRQVSRRAAAVYLHHGIVWRSAKALFAAGEIRAPEGLRDLMSKVYGPDALEYPDALEEASMCAEGKDMSGKSIAQNNLLKLELGYGGQNAIWESDADVLTRLEDEPTTTFRLARLIEGCIVPWCADMTDNRPDGASSSWAMSEVRVQNGIANGVPKQDKHTERLIAAAKETWGKWEKDIPLLLLERTDEGESWRGSVTHKNQVAAVLYDTRLGLRLS